MGASRAERRQRIEQKHRAGQLLLLDVADAFYLLQQHREELSAFETTRVTLLQRLDELHERERLGRSRMSELASAEAQLRRLEADLEEAKSQERMSRQLLSFLTGLDDIGALTDPQVETPPREPQEAYLAKAGARPDLRAAEAAWQAAKKQVGIARAGFFPTVDLDANYYVERAGAAEDVKWDASLNVDVPILQGGQNVGALKEAAAKARAEKLRYDETRRRAFLDIRDAYTEFEASVAIDEALQQALGAAEENYRLQVEDYRLNLVSNLDVLQTLQELQNTRREAIQARYNAKRS